VGDTTASMTSYTYRLPISNDITVVPDLIVVQPAGSCSTLSSIFKVAAMVTEIMAKHPTPPGSVASAKPIKRPRPSSPAWWPEVTN
jgi:hypothetical protein